MRKVAFTVAVLGVAAIIWALFPVGSAEGEGGAEAARAEPERSRPRDSMPASGRPVRPSLDGQTPSLEQPVDAAEGLLEVRVTAQGRPRAGAQVRLYWRGAEDPNTNAIEWRLAGTGATGEDGAVRLPARPGNYLVSARAQGLAPVRRELVRPMGEPLTRVELALVPGVTLRARTVAKRTGEPIPLVEVRLIADAGGASGRAQAPAEEQVFANSDAQGQVRVDGLAPGPYRVEARSVGYSRWVRDEFSVPHLGELTIQLEGAGVLEGFVVDSAGKPAAGATVMVIGDEEPAVVTTGQGGGFSAEVEGGTYQLTARHGDQTASLLQPVVAPAGTTVRGLRLELEAAGALEGKVVSAADGSPVAGARIMVSPYLKAGDSGRAVSGADGSYAVEGLAPGSYDVVVSAPGFSELSRRGVTVVASQRFPLRLELHGTGSVEGVVRDSAGRAVAGVAVREGLRREGGPLTSLPVEARTDAEGRYRLEGLSAGRVRLVARREGEAAAGAAQEVEIREGQTERADFTLVDAGVIEGRVTRENGGPPTRPTLVVAAPQGRWSGWSRMNAPVGPDGSFRMELAPGDYSLTTALAEMDLWKSGTGSRVLTTVESGKTVRVDLTTPDDEVGKGLAGQVVEADGTPSPGAEVLVSGSGIHVRMTADADGRFTVPTEGIRADREIRVRARNGGRVGEMPARASDASVRVTLKPSSVLRGRLIAVDGPPVTGFTVQVVAGESGRGRTQGGEQRQFAGDRYEIYDVPTGGVRVIARTNDGRRGEAEAHIVDAETVLDIPLERGATVVGRAVDGESGRPITDGVASVGGTRNTLGHFGLDGSFKLVDLPPGEHTIRVWAPSRSLHERHVALAPGQVLDLGNVLLEPQRAEPGTIGVQLLESGGQVTVGWLIPDGPAQQAGVRAGDVIVAVDGGAARSLGDVFQRIRGAPGTPVMLTVRRSGTEQTLNVTRAR